MQSVHTTVHSFNDQPTEAEDAAHMAYCIDQMEEVLNEPGHDLDAPENFPESYNEYLRDMAIQQADEAHGAEMLKAIDKARELAGIRSDVSRSLLVSHRTGKPVSHWGCSISGKSIYVTGTGNIADEALNAAMERLDSDARLTPVFAGYRVQGISLVGGFPHRSKSDALAIARRIALDVAYLDVCLSLNLDGVIDERPAPVVAAVA